MKPTPRVRNYMSTEVHCLAPDADVYQAVAFLLEHGISGAPVTEGRRLVGVISEKDCLMLLAAGADAVLAEARVESFMSRDVRTVTPDAEIVEVASRFLQDSCRRYPVVEDGVVVGLISRRDVLRAIQRLHEDSREGEPLPDREGAPRPRRRDRR